MSAEEEHTNTDDTAQFEYTEEADPVEGQQEAAEIGENQETEEDVNALRDQLAKWEAEAKAMEELQSGGDGTEKGSEVDEAQAEADAKSIYVGNVDYSTTPEELEEYFSACGVVGRVTIPVDKFTQTPKGFAYVQFEDVDSAVSAVLLNETEFKGRPLKIGPKRTNVPWFKQPGARGGGAARGGRGGRGRGRGGYMPMPMYMPPMGMPYMYYPRGGFTGAPRGRGGAGRGTRGRHQPY